MSGTQRQHPRVNSPKVLVRIPTLEKFRTHYLRDISQGGLFVRTDKPLDMGRTIDIQLEVPGWEQPMTLRGKVVRVDNDEKARANNAVGFAVQFDTLPEETQKRLAQLIADQEAAKMDPERERLRAEVQTLKFELGTLQEALNGRPQAQAGEGTGRPAGAGWVPEQVRALRQALQEEEAKARDAFERKLSELEAQAGRTDAELRAQVDVEKAGRLSAEARAESLAQRVRELEAAAQAPASQADRAALEDQLQAEKRARAEAEARAKVLGERLAELETRLLESQKESSEREDQMEQFLGEAAGPAAKEKARPEPAPQVPTLEASAAKEIPAAAEAKVASGASAPSAPPAKPAAPAVVAAEPAAKSGARPGGPAAPILFPEPTPPVGRLAEAGEALERLSAWEASLADAGKPAEEAEEVSGVFEIPAEGASAEAAKPPAMPQPPADYDPDISGLVELPPLPPPPEEPAAAAAPAASKAAAPEPAMEFDGEVSGVFELPPSPPSEPAAPPIPDAPKPVEAPKAVAEDVAEGFQMEEEPTTAISTRAKPGTEAATGATASSRYDFQEFQKQLKQGAGLKRLPKFHWHMTTDPAELQVMSWLEVSDSFDAVKGQARGKMNDDRIAKVMFDFYCRSLIDLAQSQSA